MSLLFAFCGAALAAVNVNTATKEELDALKGIGPVKAQAIIDYRTKNGPFKSVDDLQNVKGIGPKTLEDLRNEISIRGPTTTAAKPAAAPAKADIAKPAAPAAPVKATEASKTQAPPTAAANTKSPKKDAAPATKAGPPASSAPAASAGGTGPAKADEKNEATKSKGRKAKADDTKATPKD